MVISRRGVLVCELVGHNGVLSLEEVGEEGLNGARDHANFAPDGPQSCPELLDVGGDLGVDDVELQDGEIGELEVS